MAYNTFSDIPIDQTDKDAVSVHTAVSGDRLTGTVLQNKQVFDAYPDMIVTHFNSVWQTIYTTYFHNNYTFHQAPEVGVKLIKRKARSLYCARPALSGPRNCRHRLNKQLDPTPICKATHMPPTGGVRWMFTHL